MRSRPATRASFGSPPRGPCWKCAPRQHAEGHRQELRKQYLFGEMRRRDRRVSRVYLIERNDRKRHRDDSEHRDQDLQRRRERAVTAGVER